MITLVKWTRRAALLSVGLSLVNCASTSSGASKGAEHSGATASEQGKWVGQAAPAFTLSSADGSQSVSLSELSGKVVVVDFWATWCDPCKESFPSYQRLAEEFGDDLVVLGVSVDEEADGIAAFKKATGVSFTLLWDEAGSAAEKYAPPKMPTSFVIDQQGIVRHMHAGYHTDEEELLRGEIKALIGK